MALAQSCQREQELAQLGGGISLLPKLPRDTTERESGFLQQPESDPPPQPLPWHLSGSQPALYLQLLLWVLADLSHQECQRRPGRDTPKSALIFPSHKSTLPTPLGHISGSQAVQPQTPAPLPAHSWGVLPSALPSSELPGQLHT